MTLINLKAVSTTYSILMISLHLHTKHCLLPFDPIKLLNNVSGN